MVNVTAALILNAQEENKRKVAADKARVANLSKQLQMRLQYARLKVEHGWQRQSLNEVENLYFRHSTASKTVPKPKSTVRFTPSFQNITFSPPSNSAGPSQQGADTSAPTQVTSTDYVMSNVPAASPIPSATSVAEGSSTSIDPPTSQVPQRTPTLPDMPPPSVPSSTSISSYSDASRVSSSHPTTAYTTPSPSTSMNSNAFAATSSSHAPQASSSTNSASSSNQNGSSPGLTVGGGYGSAPQKTYPYPATSSNFSSNHANPPPLQQSSSQSHSQYPPQYHQQQNSHPSHSTSLTPAQLQNSQALAAYIAAQTQANYLASLSSSASSSASASLSSTPQPYPYPQTQNQSLSNANTKPAGSAQTLTHAHMSNPYLSPLVQQHPQYYPMQNQLHPQVLHQIQRLQAAQTHLRAQAAQLGSVPQPTPSTSHYRDPSQAPATGFHNHLVPTGQTAAAAAPNGFGGVHSHPHQRQHQPQQLPAQTTSSETLQLGAIPLPLKTFDIPTAPSPAPPPSTTPTGTETPTTQAGQMQMGLNPMQSNGSLTYDSFWSTHTMAAGNWRKVVAQGSGGNLGGLGDAMVGGSGFPDGTTDASGMEASMGDGMQVQSTGVPMSSTDGLHG